MANVYAVKSGNWSDTTVWNTGALPTSADDVYANTFTVTVDVTSTVLTIRNTSATGISAGGTFSFANNSSLTCTNTITTYQNGFIVFSLSSGNSTTIRANFNFNQNAGNATAINNSSSGTLNIIGNVGYSYQNGGQTVLRNSSSGIVNITGDVFGGQAFNSTNYGLVNSSSGVINVTGSVFCITSISSSGANTSVILNSSVGAINITGTCTLALSPVGQFIVNNGSGSISITGSVISSVADYYAVSNSSSGTLIIIGSVTCQNTLAAIGPGSVSQLTYLSGPFIGTQFGTPSNASVRWRWIASVGSSYMTVPNSTATGYKNLFTVDAAGSGSGQPAVTNVRSGTVYGPASELTGTCAVPAAASVAFGVPVDNTTGTATLTAANVQAALTSQGLTTTRAGYLDRLPNTSTTQEVADIIDAAI